MIFYTNKLGCTLEWEYGDPPGYAGVKFGTADIHLSENPDVTNTGESVWLYIMVEDVDTLYNGLVANGVDVDGPRATPVGDA